MTLGEAPGSPIASLGNLFFHQDKPHCDLLQRLDRCIAASEDIPTFRVRVADTVEFDLCMARSDRESARIGLQIRTRDQCPRSA